MPRDVDRELRRGHSDKYQPSALTGSHEDACHSRSICRTCPFGVADWISRDRASANEAGECSYYKVEYHRFKPGKADEGRAFIRKYYRPADRAAGIQVLEFTPVTGDWDWIAFFPVEPDFLVWQRPAMSLRARAKFEQTAGGADEATKLDKEFNNLVQEVRIEIMKRDVEK